MDLCLRRSRNDPADDASPVDEGVGVLTSSQFSCEFWNTARQLSQRLELPDLLPPPLVVTVIILLPTTHVPCWPSFNRNWATGVLQYTVSQHFIL